MEYSNNSKEKFHENYLYLRDIAWPMIKKLPRIVTSLNLKIYIYTYSILIYFKFNASGNRFYPTK